jgi:hypothetical protein
MRTAAGLSPATQAPTEAISLRAQLSLVRHSSVSLRTIRRAELAERNTAMTSANNLAVRRALESEGVEFIDENGGGPGVRLRNRPTRK